jgi:hypothetical protein
MVRWRDDAECAGRQRPGPGVPFHLVAIPKATVTDVKFEKAAK